MIASTTVELVEWVKASATNLPGSNLPAQSLGLRRAARLPVLGALQVETQRPVLLVTDRTDHALTLFDELGLWLPDITRIFIPEPNPLFYENAPGVKARVWIDWQR